MSNNPYAAPRANVAEARPLGLPLSTPLASSWARFANMLLDWIFGWMFTWLCAVVLGAALAVMGNTTWFTNALLAQVIGMALFTAYYLVFEAAFGWTIAKLITGTRVVDAGGRKPAFLNLLGRSLVRNVPFEQFSFLGGTGIGWHDRWSKTRVVSLRRSSGPTLEDSFKPDFDPPAKEAAAKAQTGRAWTPSDGPPAWCPNCGKQIAAVAEKCGGCAADFTSPEGWKPLEERPSWAPTSPPASR